MVFDNFFYYGKPDACACIFFFTVKFLEYLKNAFAEAERIVHPAMLFLDLSKMPVSALL